MVLDLNPETVQFIIDRAHEYQTQDGLMTSDDDVLPDEVVDDEFVREIDDPVFLELQSTIDDLEPDQQVSLVALMWIGRGDYSLSEWATALERAGESWNTRAAEYLIRTPLLADYLSEGLAQFAEDEEE
jgi:hypothetical protein